MVCKVDRVAAFGTYRDIVYRSKILTGESVAVLPNQTYGEGRAENIQCLFGRVTLRVGPGAHGVNYL